MFDDIKDTFDDFNSDIENSSGIINKTKSLAKGRKEISADKLDSEFERLKRRLIESDIQREIAEHIVEETKKKVDGQKVKLTKSTAYHVRQSLKEVIRDIFAMNNQNLDKIIEEREKPVVILVAGVNGVGKTTTIAKLANRWQDMGYSCTIANGDTFRAGARKQIEQHAENINVNKLITHQQGSDPASVLYDAVDYAKANNIDIVIGDTAGRLNTQDGLMNQLSKIDRVVEPDFKILVEDATTGQDAVKRADEFNEALDGIHGVILTKIDATKTGGPVLSIPFSLNLPVLYIGTGEKYEDIEYLYPDEFAERITER